MKTHLLAGITAAILCAAHSAAPASAQIYIGTADLPATGNYHVYESQGNVGQSFIAQGLYLSMFRLFITDAVDYAADSPGLTADWHYRFSVVEFEDNPEFITLQDRPKLYQSAFIPGSETPGWIEFNKLGVKVTAGHRYAAYISFTPFDSSLYLDVPLLDSDTYADGTFLSDYGTPFDGDILFEARMEVAPEPTSIILVASGLAGIAAQHRRKRAAARGM
jgi:hypothetical protein